MSSSCRYHRRPHITIVTVSSFLLFAQKEEKTNEKEGDSVRLQRQQRTFLPACPSYRFLDPRRSAATIIASKKSTPKTDFSAKQRKLKTKTTAKVRGRAQTSVLWWCQDETYLFCFADGVGIMVDCCVSETKKWKSGGMLEKVTLPRQKKRKINSGKKWGWRPKIEVGFDR